MNNTVYITKGNFYKIVSSRSDYSLKVNANQLYDLDIKSLLSTPEIKLLYLTMEAFKDFDKFIQRFNNFLIPEEIKSRGSNEIKKFRIFFKQNSYLIQNNERSFLNKLESQFFLKNPPEKVEYDNSGVELINNYNLNELKEEIDKLLISADKYKKSSPEIEKLITNKGYGTHKVKSAKDKLNPLYTWHTYKTNLKSLLTEYFKLKFNPDLSFDKNLLDELGFVSCQHCNPLKKS